MAAKRFTIIKLGIANHSEEAERQASEACDNGWSLVSIAPYAGSQFMLITLRHIGEGSDPLPHLPRGWQMPYHD